jgi:peptide chain release factor subunit 1
LQKDFFERFKGVLIGDRGPTKRNLRLEVFFITGSEKESSGFSMCYTNEDGLAELVDAAKDALKGMGVVKEKEFMQRFLKELVKDAGLAAYGEESIRKNLEIGAVDTLLLSANLRKSRLRIKFQSCDYTHEQTINVEPGKTVREIDLGSCPKCTAPIILEEETDIIDELAKLADASSAKVEIISDDFEEGSILFTAFGGIAAILRYRTGY